MTTAGYLTLTLNYVVAGSITAFISLALRFPPLSISFPRCKLDKSRFVFRSSYCSTSEYEAAITYEYKRMTLQKSRFRPYFVNNALS
jgi:hypothetical protein